MPSNPRHGRLVRLRWAPDPDAYGPRRERKAAAYDAFVPTLLADADLPLLASTAAAAGAAELACRQLDRSHSAAGGLEALARLALRAESVASSHIEGLVLSHRRLARAAFAKDETDMTAQHVLANVRAMERAVELARDASAVTPRMLLDIHRVLFEGTRDARLGGKRRREQNWVGGHGSSPAGAEFVPPPADLVPGLIADLCSFCNRRDVPAVILAAAAHAQFETIHPFPDGNGRVGRALIHVLLTRAGLASTRIPPVSLALAGSAAAYVRGLGDFRFAERDDWYVYFARSLERACAESLELAARIEALQARWAHAAGSPREGSAAARLIACLPDNPIVDLASACALTGASDEAVRLALNGLASAGVLRQVSAGLRNRSFECVGLFDLLDSFERKLGDSRRTPRRTR